MNDTTNKTRRQLWAIYHNNAPRSTAWYCNKEKAQAKHRAAYAQIQKLLNK